MTAETRIFIAWKTKPHLRNGSFAVRQGTLRELTVYAGSPGIDGNAVEIAACSPAVLELRLELSTALYGEAASVIQWREEAGGNGQGGFSFLPASIPAKGALQIPDLGVSIARTSEDLLNPGGPEAGDAKDGSYEDALNHGGFPKGRGIGWETWAAHNNRCPDVPTVLGLSFDQRMFVVDPGKNTITASMDLTFPALGYVFARSATADGRCVRRLEDGCLPILHVREDWGGIVIEDTIFASLVDRPLTEANVAGTPLKTSHLYSNHATFPPGMKEEAQQEAATLEPEGELVLFVRSRLTNRSGIPRVTPQHLPKVFFINESKSRPMETPLMARVKDTASLDIHGVGWTRGLPLSRHQVNGAPPSSLQPCMILGPGESMTIDSILSHCREGLSGTAQNGAIAWDEKFAEAKAFWKEKLRPAASADLPESRLADFWKAGLLHLELVTLGRAREGALLPKVGIYPPIGSESIPIVEFYDSVGLHEIARRCVDSFFDLQHPSGRINLFSHYDIETGGALFLAGRHFAYTRDLAWASARMPGLKRAAGYLLGQRRLEDPEAPNYGLIAGTCADPVDATTSFMLNAYAAAGLLAVAEMMEATGDAEASTAREEAEAFATCYRNAFAGSFARGPVVPTAPGRWVPTCSSSVEGIGLEIMGLKGEAGFTHRAYAVFDALLGPLYGVFAGIVDPEGIHAQWLLEVNHSQLNRACVSESQPYYGRHPEVHLLRGEREAFLNAFYSGLTSLADRETFTFWEHYYQLTPHKTHEEGWALMQLRRMLWLEAGGELRLLPGIPEEWLDVGKSVEINGGGSYFGGLSFRVERSGPGTIRLHWTPDFHTSPEKVSVHLPGLSVRGSREPRLSVLSGGRVEIGDPAAPLTATLELD